MQWGAPTGAWRPKIAAMAVEVICKFDAGPEFSGETFERTIAPEGAFPRNFSTRDTHARRRETDDRSWIIEHQLGIESEVR